MKIFKGFNSKRAKAKYDWNGFYKVADSETAGVFGIPIRIGEFSIIRVFLTFELLAEFIWMHTLIGFVP